MPVKEKKNYHLETCFELFILLVYCLLFMLGFVGFLFVSYNDIFGEREVEIRIGKHR